MKQLQILLPKKQLDGQVTALELNLQTLAPVQITGVRFSSPGRLVICADKATRDKLISKDTTRVNHFQFTDAAPAGVLLHIASNVIWSEFDFTRPQKVGQVVWFRHPQKWQPVTVQANNKEGKTFCMIESRAGNAKHKAELVITLQVTDG